MILIYKNIDFFSKLCYSCFCIIVFFKIKIDKILLKFHYIKKGLSELVLLSFKREILEKLKCKWPLGSNFVYMCVCVL